MPTLDSLQSNLTLLIGIALCVIALLARILIRAPKKPSARMLAWKDFASATGGTLSQERRRRTPLGWTGGPTVRWDRNGIEVTLSTSSEAGRDDLTRFAADVTLARGFQLHLIQENLLRKVFFSNQLWHVALAAVKERAERARRHEPRGAREGDRVAERLAFLSAEEMLVGDPRFDDAFFVKSDQVARAREFLTDSGVATSLLDLDRESEAWQFSLTCSDQAAGAYRLTLALPGSGMRPGELDASRRLFEASLRCLSERGMLASANPQAA